MTYGLAQALRDYQAAWNELDTGAPARLLAACVTDGVVMPPGYEREAPLIRGRDALAAEIGRMIARRPPGRGFRLTLTSKVEEHHGWARFRWHVADPNGAVLTVGGMELAGLDVVRLAEHGRLEQIIVFVGA